MVLKRLTNDNIKKIPNIEYREKDSELMLFFYKIAFLQNDVFIASFCGPQRIKRQVFHITSRLLNQDYEYG